MTDASDPRTKRILIVDDDQALREFLEQVLREEGFQTAGASNGEEALKLMEESSFDLIMTDLIMPGTGGFEVLRRLQTGRRRIPVLVISGKSLDSSTEEMIRAEGNVVDFLPKPVRAAALALRLHQILGTGSRT